MNKHLPIWIEGLYDFIFVLAICVFGFGVQIGYLYVKDQIIKKQKILVWFLINLSISYFLNVVMKKLGWVNWTWVVVWLYNANSFWILDVVSVRIKSTIEILIPSFITAWVDKFKPKNPQDNDRNQNS